MPMSESEAVWVEIVAGLWSWSISSAIHSNGFKRSSQYLA
jgi:hypothetical protein